MEVERQGHEPPEQLAAELGDDPLPHHAEQVRLEEAADGLDAEQPDEQDDQAVEAGRVAAGDDLGRDPGDDQREGQPDGRRDDQADEGDRERPPGAAAGSANRRAHGTPPNPRTSRTTAPGVGRDAGELLGHPTDDAISRRDAQPTFGIIRQSRDRARVGGTHLTTVTAAGQPSRPSRFAAIHPLLFAAYPVLFLWSQNLGETDPADVVLPLVVLVGIAAS